MQLQQIESKIYEIRGLKVMFDFNLAELYEVETRVLNQAVKRNEDVFPKDFMFRLTLKEWQTMSSQIVMTYPNKRPKTSLPLVFSEHGVAMLATVLKSKKAKQISISIVRAFIALRQVAMHYKELAEKLKELEVNSNQKFDDVYNVLNYLVDKEKEAEDYKDRKRIGFKAKK